MLRSRKKNFLHDFLENRGRKAPKFATVFPLWELLPSVHHLRAMQGEPLGQAHARKGLEDHFLTTKGVDCLRVLTEIRDLRIASY